MLTVLVSVVYRSSALNPAALEIRLFQLRPKSGYGQISYGLRPNFQNVAEKLLKSVSVTKSNKSGSGTALVTILLSRVYLVRV